MAPDFESILSHTIKVFYDFDVGNLVAFPSLADLRVNLTDKEDFRLGMWCFTRNPYMYLDNFDVLVTSGSVSVQLEYMDGTPIP
ncbi:unnamed protein product [Haemonchus placei]|uniref:Uncharacterized protein n=1 Tax=Haemonchus placei TaxID=6290 RepID=A0A3P7UNU2_HAEPC|nr:unnamed protein product [Haemonchus placei]